MDETPLIAVVHTSKDLVVIVIQKLLVVRIQVCSRGIQKVSLQDVVGR